MKMNAEAHQHLVALGLAPAQLVPLQPLPNVDPALLEAQFRAADEADNEVVWPTEGDLGRMLSWQDLANDAYHLHKFQTGRTFKNRGFYENTLVDFYQRIYFTYPEEVRSGAVAYDPNVHDQKTNLYEGQLQFLETMIVREKR
jgi:hypothetical protein